nr:MAG TPA: hypothetical protein [Caudoviricetes sp.]
MEYIDEKDELAINFSLGRIDVIQYLILAIHNLKWMFYPSIDLISRYWGAIYNLNV